MIVGLCHDGFIFVTLFVKQQQRGTFGDFRQFARLKYAKTLLEFAEGLRQVRARF